MKAEKLDTKAVANEALAPLIEHCNKTVGSKAELAKKMSEALDYNVHRQIAEGWVHADPAKRVEPKLGLGLVLLRIGGEMMGERKPLQIGRVMTRAFKPAKNGESKPAKAKKPKAERKPKAARNGKVAAWPPGGASDVGAINKAYPAPRKRKPKAMSSADLDAVGSVPASPRARKPKADVRKAIPPATQWPAKPKPRKS